MICFFNLNRCYHISRLCLQTHYDTLGISKTATHAEIKSAYYKLSMMHHPDRQDGSREKFEKITDAYKIPSKESKYVYYILERIFQILGDIQSRKLYDRGAFQGSLNKQKEAPRNYYSQTAAHVRRPDVPSGKNPIYDFDMWSREHYGRAMERRREAKARYDYNKNARNFDEQHRQKDNVTMVVLVTALITGFIVFTHRLGNEDFDKPPPSQSPTNKS